MGSPPPVQDTPGSKWPTEPQSSSLVEPCSEQEDNGRRTVTGRVEPKPAEENGAVAGQSAAKKRRNSVLTVSKTHMKFPVELCSLHIFNITLNSTVRFLMKNQ